MAQVLYCPVIQRVIVVGMEVVKLLRKNTHQGSMVVESKLNKRILFAAHKTCGGTATRSLRRPKCGR